jgi:hypothetical protein
MVKGTTYEENHYALSPTLLLPSLSRSKNYSQYVFCAQFPSIYDPRLGWQNNFN